jgi:transposase
MMRDLLELSTWLAEAKCPIVAMESTGVYWKPVYHVLQGGVEVVVGNPRSMRRPGSAGQKTDKTDADWISELLAHGLVARSYVPSPANAALRDLTRMRVKCVQTRTDAKNRIHKVLQDTNIKLASVASNIFGKSGREMLDALVRGERNAKKLSRMAYGVLANKTSQLELALHGRFTPHHATLIDINLQQIDLLNSNIVVIDQKIAELMTPHQHDQDRLTTIPGVDKTAARAIIAEIGTDMSQFGTPKRLACWSGVAPGNNESAGKRRRAKTRQGNRYLRRILCQCAWAARKTDSFIGKTFRSLEARIGGKKAALAIGHKILVIAYHLLLNGDQYDSKRYCETHSRLTERWQKNAVHTLERLGFEVQLVPAPAA